MGRSILDDLGQEVTGIVSPVSICLFITVALVRLLNPEGDSDTGAVYLAQMYYSEEDGDSTGQKLSGSVINALIFVSIIGAMTFLLVLLFKYGCTKIIYAYMGFAGFSIFFVLTGIILIQLLQLANIHMDWISFTYILSNFAMVGAVTLFFTPAPLLVKQCYLVVTGVATAFVFTWIPEWTTWVLLVAMALYDIVAVLIPGGPLKMLVELAQEREEEIPALVYQARSTQLPSVPAAAAAAGGVGATVLSPPQQAVAEAASGRREELANAPESGRTTPAGEASPETPLVATLGTLSSHEDLSAAEATRAAAATHAQRDLEATASCTEQQQPSHQQPRQPTNLERPSPTMSDDFGLPDAIKLGLGDFIFYSVLVGRAAMFDWLTVAVCYIAIIAGLGCTLLWLALAHHALPALPISIALAVVFYFVGRFVMEPVVLPMTLRLVYF